MSRRRILDCGFWFISVSVFDIGRTGLILIIYKVPLIKSTLFMKISVTSSPFGSLYCVKGGIYRNSKSRLRSRSSSILTIVSRSFRSNPLSYRAC